MKTKWLIQTGGINTSNLDKIYYTLNKLNFNFNDFGLIPFTNTITNLEDCLEPDKNFIIKGGTKFLTLLDKVDNLLECSKELNAEQITNSKEYIDKLKAGIDYDIEKFDIVNYINKELPLLNAQAIYKPYEEIKTDIFTEDMFIKPSKDLKAFDGGILDKGMTIEEFIKNSLHQSFFNEETIIVSPLKRIYSEYRFFIINNEIITASMYKRGHTVSYDSLIPDYMLDCAKEYAKLYTPADIFVMDLAETDEGIKIIEYNCWNASGLYHSNVAKLFNEVNDFKSI